MSQPPLGRELGKLLLAILATLVLAAVCSWAYLELIY